MKVVPLFVWMNIPEKKYKSALRLDGKEYWRDAGAWGCGYQWKGDKLFSVCEVEYAHDRELLECTEQEWREDNKGYLSED